MQETVVGSRAAARLAGVSSATICAWCARYGIGERYKNSWRIRVAELDRILKARAVLRGS